MKIQCVSHSPSIAPFAALVLLAHLLAVGCGQAHRPSEGSTRTEDTSQVVYSHSWLKTNVLVRNIQADRLEGNLLRVVARFHSKEAATSRIVRVRTEFYSPAMEDGGIIVDTSVWDRFVLEPRKSVQYEVNSLVPADDFRIYVYYDQDLGM